MKDNSRHFFVGQEVSLMHTKGIFRVNALRDETAIVTDEHGFDFSVSLKELVALHGKESAPDSEDFSKILRVQPTNGAYLLFDGDLKKAFLFNAHGLPMMFLLYAVQKNNLALLTKGMLEAENTGGFFEISPNDLKNLQLACLWLPENSGSIPVWFSRQVRVSLHNQVVLIPQYKQPVHLIQLVSLEDYHASMMESTLSGIQPKEPTLHPSKPDAVKSGQTDTIDLHIDALTDASERMQAHEKLSLQLNTFRKKLDECRLRKISSLVVIHGVGKGTLKNEVLKIIADEEGIRSKDAPYETYGYGATLVSFF